MDAAAKVVKPTETVTRSRVVADAEGDVRGRHRAHKAAANNDDDRQLATYAPSGRSLARFRRPCEQSVSCSPLVLSILTDLLGMRLFGTLSEVCTAWYDGVRAKEDEWAVLTATASGGFGSGTGPGDGELDLQDHGV